jgi:PAS domain S-box-containing protein
MAKTPTSIERKPLVVPGVTDTLQKHAEIDYRAMVETTSIGITETETGTGRIYFANEAFCRMIGYTSAELSEGNLSFIELTHPDDREMNVAVYNQFVSGSIPSFTIEKRYVRKDGSEFWGRMTASLFPKRIEGELPDTLAFIEDISRERLARQQLALAEEFAGIASWTWDTRTNTATCSAAHNALYGIAPSAPAPSIGEFLSRVHPDDRDRIAVRVRSAGKANQYTDQFRIVRPDGEIRWVKSVAALVRDSSGRVTNFMGTIFDITEFKDLEQRLLEQSSIENTSTTDTAVTAKPGLRAAEEYIRHNWNKPLANVLLAQLAGVSTRQYFKLFRQVRGCTPNVFVKRVRLKHARSMLQNEAIEHSVGGVALACGFSNLGHFARDYRLAFGELPSITLNRRRSRRSKSHPTR